MLGRRELPRSRKRWRAVVTTDFGSLHGERISEWAKANGKDSHSEAMRHLLELGLSVPKRGRAGK
jgi:hypothetical protein